MKAKFEATSKIKELTEVLRLLFSLFVVGSFIGQYLHS